MVDVPENVKNDFEFVQDFSENNFLIKINFVFTAPQMYGFAYIKFKLSLIKI